MFCNRIEDYKKPVAWFFFFIFYMQLVSPVLANAFAKKTLYSEVNKSFGTSYKKLVSVPVSELIKKPASFRHKKISENARQVSFISDDLGVSDKSAANKIVSSGGPGPTQPEMQSFQSVNSNNMVDLFTGDFSYSIPLLDVGGYPVNLHYNSGITMDQEASWVGLGWNINPGTINRNMRGLPDDFNGPADQITKTLKLKDNKTVGVTGGGGIEIIGHSLGLSATLGVFHNNYNGWGIENGVNAGINAGCGAKGPLSGGLSITNNSQSGLDIAPSLSFRMGKTEAQSKGSVSIGTNYNSRTGIQGLQMTAQLKQQTNQYVMVKGKKKYSDVGVGVESYLSFATPSFTPTVTVPFTSKQFTFTGKVGSETWAYHPNFFVQGSFSNQYIADEDTIRRIDSYGYLYTQNSRSRQDVLLDFNREKEVAFRGTTPNIAIPGYTYDIYSITGEGIGGMFRPYRSDIGMVYDHTVSTKSESGRASIDLGFGDVFHGGIDLNAVIANSTTNAWRDNNVFSRYLSNHDQDSLYENVYFKNPGEKVTIDQDFYDRIGDDKLARVELSPIYGHNSPSVSATRNLTLFKDARKIGTIGLDAATNRIKRDKRTQVISYLTADDASLAALDPFIKIFDINHFPSNTCSNNYHILPRVGGIRQPHHISEITVLNTEGKRYVYGIPAYNIEQDDVTFSVDKAQGNITTGLVSYDPSIDNTTRNNKGIDNYFSREKIPPYAHSFLLTSILSSDYVDLTGDGVTEDDNGDAVKFNYSRVNGENNPYLWRAPFEQNKASYSEGLKTYSRDDKGSYSFGKKEVWYMNSIESKTMIATFVLEQDTLRKDSYGTVDENGGRGAQQGLYRLREINLYTKADFLKNGTSVAKPIKTVHFAYSYELCPGMPSSVLNTGKLTLKKVWFTYNKNDKGKLNPYIFSYHSNIPSFNSASYDRWGNYKDPTDNPGPGGNTLTNAEYPYTLQKGIKSWDSTKAANNIAAWTLNQVKLPSGALMQVSYESDDYAYVQNRRAMQMFSIAGLGYVSTDDPSPTLHQSNAKDKDNLYLFIKLPEPVSGKDEIRARYLDNLKQLYFKLFVKMPDDRWGTGYEQIPCFADIVDYDVKSGYDNRMIWIKIRALKGTDSPLATAAIQYLRVNLPGKAYPYSEPGDDVSIQDVIGMILSVGANFKNAINKFENEMRKKNVCNDIDTAKSFVRMQNPYFKKWGGGLRVKKIEIFDNWHTMTNQTEASYGQYYNYTTTKSVNGVPSNISSGVASYEPVLGKEENPFYMPIEYAEKMAPLGPTDYIFTEEPLGESFFPSPTVGYSRVAVQTINNTKKSANGIDVTEFYTASDFPTLFEHTALDNESKKPFANPIGNFFKFDAKRYITLSQGFKVELNDMHGKIKSQLSFAQTDLQHPIISTYNYYKLDQDNALNKHLSGNVSTIDSANGVVNTNSKMGKDIDIFIDAREQTSKTVSASFQLNIDFANYWPPVILPSLPRLPTFETNRYRSIAVTKVINRYGILDSVVHVDKGSKISTANMVYDGETGNVLLSRTQNEFDDPVYNFNYPAYWAYAGMGSAYKNIKGVFYFVNFLNGKMDYKGMDPVALKRYFESGDEVLFYGKLRRGSHSSDQCTGGSGYTVDTSVKIWAIDVAKAGPGNAGIYFIDKNGNPVNGFGFFVKIIRSGKRNLTSASAGSITSLENPVKLIGGQSRLVFDSTTAVVAASAARFKDLWQVDSVTYRKDTSVRSVSLIQSQFATLSAISNSSVGITKILNFTFPIIRRPDAHRFESSSIRSSGSLPVGVKSSIKFSDFDGNIPRNAIITNATFYASGYPFYQVWGRTPNNAAYISRSLGLSLTDYILTLPPVDLVSAYYNTGSFAIDYTTRMYVGPTTPQGSIGHVSLFSGNIKTLVQNMVNDYYNTNHWLKPSLVIDQVNNSLDELSSGENNMQFGYDCGVKSNCRPSLSAEFIPPCADGTTPSFLTTPEPGYYCYSEPRDSFVCSPIINDTAVNPYRWGIWGNWRSDRNYVYYNLRKDSIATAITNIRKDGQIRSFMPYWSFSGTTLQPSIDSSRWVWNTEINMVNSKGLELQNHDPLNRYNAAQYGYNQTLPVAVTQNSRYREMMFDGFEDYGYTTDNCKSCPPNRFINLLDIGSLVDTVSHTGLYSLRIPGNQSNNTTVAVVPQDLDTASHPHITVTVDTSSTGPVPLQIQGKGTGLNGEYIKYEGITPATCTTRLDSTINFTVWGTGSPDSCEPAWHSRVTWQGYIQPKYSELYHFNATASNRMQVWLNNTLISGHSPVQNTSGTFDLDTMTLVAGKLYPVKIVVNKAGGGLAAVLRWSSVSQQLSIISKSQLYTNTDTSGTTFIGFEQCLNLHSPQQSQVSLPNFSPYQNTKILVGAWVKERNNNADTVTSFRNVQLQLVFTGGTGSTVTLKPAGNIIEGWQRIEDTLTIPSTATQMTIKLMSTNSSVPVYFDDIRIHPFNSNMKSYIYNPLNLRFMAELDENNYAGFYEYDDDGTLIRVKKETERGIKTIKETRSALLKDY